ncbi:hypothetical protein W1240910_151 [Cyanophage S-RIM12_W1_24_0910]|uniref:Uncharacterized protein n=1 Tax=Cyanophage S-RIM12 TaxID=1278402 RepID=A0A1D7SZB7_9CAUD|nr:hypothetical protein W1240910_151 [Cyanophage S-RIM12_W1_24_0910]
MEIPNISIPNSSINIADIRDVNINMMPDWMTNPPQAIPIYPPVTSQVGIPIVNIPGCVESHRDSSENQTLKDEDSDGVRVYCDAGTPSFNPIDYDPRRLKITTESSPPLPVIPNTPEAPETPATPTPPKTDAAKVECPSRAQELKNPVGKIIEGNKKITGYETVGKECLPVFETLNITDQIVQNIPSAGMITVTASIAVVATTSALLAKPLADLLLKVVKPVTKKVVKKIAALRGKKPPVLSESERKAAQRDRNRAIKVLRSALKPKG